MKTTICEAVSATPHATPHVRARPRSCIAQPQNRTARNRRAVQAIQAILRSGQNRTASSSALLCQHQPATVGVREIGESRSRACTRASQPPTETTNEKAENASGANEKRLQPGPIASGNAPCAPLYRGGRSMTEQVLLDGRTTI